MKMKLVALVAALGLGLSACETATPYQPLAHGAKVSGGFTDQKLDAEHYRVSFEGNTLTSRATVETYLLYRAAELTLSQGFDWFETVDRHTEGQKRSFVEPSPFYGAGYGYWHPYWRYYGGLGGYGGHGYGWRGWDPFWGDPFFGDRLDVETVEKFQTSAEIVVHKGPKPDNLAKAFDAHQVTANLGPKIQRPTS